MSQLTQTHLPSFSENMIDDLCHRYLTFRYQSMYCEKAEQPIDRFYEIQGEILFPSVTKLLSHLKLTENDIFVDLGSALGKVVVQVFLQSPVKQALGIELILALHQRALAMAELIREELPDFYANNRQLTFMQGDFLNCSIDNATVVLINGVCFNPTMLHILGQLINNTPSVHTVLTLRPIGNLSLPFRKTVRIEGSWDSALCYIYSTVTDLAKLRG